MIELEEALDAYAVAVRLARQPGSMGELHKREAAIALFRALQVDAARYRWLVSARTADEADDPQVGHNVALPQDEAIAALSTVYFHKGYADALIDAERTK